MTDDSVCVATIKWATTLRLENITNPKNQQSVFNSLQYKIAIEKSQQTSSCFVLVVQSPVGTKQNLLYFEQIHVLHALC